MVAEEDSIAQRRRQRALAHLFGRQGGDGNTVRADGDDAAAPWAAGIGDAGLDRWAAIEANAALRLLPPFDRAGQAVVLAEQAGDEGRSGLLVEGAGSVALGDSTLLDDGDAVGQRHGLLPIPRRQQDGEAEAAGDAPELEGEGAARRGVEPGQRIVEQQERLLRRKRTGEGGPEARQRAELADAATFETVEAEGGQRPGNAGGAVAGGDAVAGQELRNGLLHRAAARKVWVEDGDRALRRRKARELAPGKQHPPLIRPIDAGDEAKQRGLAGAGRGEQRQAFAMGEVEVDRLQPGRSVCDAFEAQQRHVHHGPFPCQGIAARPDSVNVQGWNHRPPGRVAAPSFHPARRKTMSAANDMSNDARRLKDQAAASADRVSTDAQEELAKLRAQVERLMQERVTPALAGAADQVSDYANRAREAVEERADAISETVREKPLMAIGIAALGGYLIGRLMGGNTYVYPRDRH